MANVKNVNWAKPVDGGQVQQILGLTDALVANLKNIRAFQAYNGDGTVTMQVHCDYVGSDAITTSDYASFPKGSVIQDFQATITRIKTADATDSWATINWD